jgi:hypothetical protein
MLFNNLGPSLRKTHCGSTTRLKGSLLFREIIAVCSENYMKQRMCCVEKNLGSVNVKVRVGGEANM